VLRSVRSLPTLAVGIALSLGVVACAGGDESTEGGGGGGGAGGGGALSPVAEEGKRISADSGCAGCHGGDGQGGIGPAWAGLYSSTVELEGGATVTADDAYLRRAITDPAAEKAAGFTVAMPENQLNTEDVEAVVAYIRELAEVEPG